MINFIGNNGTYDTYWVNTISNRLVKKLITEGSKNIKMDFEKLLKGETVRHTIDEQTVYSQTDYIDSVIWNFMVATGYLKVLNKENPDSDKAGKVPIYELALANYEVKSMFVRMDEKFQLFRQGELPPAF